LREVEPGFGEPVVDAIFVVEGGLVVTELAFAERHDDMQFVIAIVAGEMREPEKGVETR